jgi:hypothetical protein
MNATESLLFNELFIGCLEDFFFQDDSKSYNIVEILDGLPVVYNLGGLVNSGIRFLVLKGTIVGDGMRPSQSFKVTLAGIQARATRNEDIR